MKHLSPLMLTLLLAASGCAHGEPERPAEAPASAAGSRLVTLPAEAREVIAIETAPVSRTALTTSQEVLGEITHRPEAETIVHAPIPGRVTAIHAAVGDRVAAGAPLATIASAELGEAQAAYLEAAGEHRLAEQEARRQETLFASELASKKERDGAAQALAVRRVRLDAAREKLRVLGVSDAEAASLTARGRVDVSLVIRAPRAGTVLERPVALGDMAAPGDAAVMFRLLDLSVVRVEADLPERGFLAVEPGQPATIALPAMGDQAVTGKVVRLAPMLDTESRTGRAMIDVPNPQGRLRPGMSCRVAIATGERQALTVPAAAVQREDKIAYAYVDRGEGSYEEQALTLGARSGEAFEVLGGLAEGDRVVTKGSFDLRSQARKAMFGGD